VKVTALELGPFQARAVILACEHTNAALVVDPGFDAGALVAEVRRERLETIIVNRELVTRLELIGDPAT